MSGAISIFCGCSALCHLHAVMLFNISRFEFILTLRFYARSIEYGCDPTARYETLQLVLLSCCHKFIFLCKYDSLYINGSSFLFNKSSYSQKSLVYILKASSKSFLFWCGGGAKACCLLPPGGASGPLFTGSHFLFTSSHVTWHCLCPQPQKGETSRNSHLSSPLVSDWNIPTLEVVWLNLRLTSFTSECKEA